MLRDRLSLLKQVFVGRTCSVKKREHDWAFSFGDNVALDVSAPWRIVTVNGIAFAGADDEQQFGLPKPIDGQATANELINGRRVRAFDVDARTADLRISFEGELSLEVFNNSSGFEGWNVTAEVDGDTLSVVGLGGGDIAFL